MSLPSGDCTRAPSGCVVVSALRLYCGRCCQLVCLGRLSAGILPSTVPLHGMVGSRVGESGNVVGMIEEACSLSALLSVLYCLFYTSLSKYQTAG